jgi:hypothetical protein
VKRAWIRIRQICDDQVFVREQEFTFNFYWHVSHVSNQHASRVKTHKPKMSLQSAAFRALPTDVASEKCESHQTPTLYESDPSTQRKRGNGALLWRMCASQQETVRWQFSSLSAAPCHFLLPARDLPSNSRNLVRTRFAGYVAAVKAVRAPDHRTDDMILAKAEQRSLLNPINRQPSCKSHQFPAGDS